MQRLPSQCPACGKDDSKERAQFEEYTVYECDNCGLSFGVPLTAVTNSSFNGYPWTQEWTQDFPEHVRKARRSLLAKKKVIAGLTGISVKSMLDIGCGNGAFLAAAGQLGIHAEGIDIDAHHTSFANAQGLLASHCDITTYETKETFDLIHIKESFHLVTESRQFIEKISTLAGDHTIVYIDSTHADGLAARYRQWTVNPPRYGQLYPPLHNRTFNQRSLQHILESAGFKALKFITFSKGDPAYCPTRKFSIRRYAINPLLDFFFAGGFIGCYAMKASAGLARTSDTGAPES